MNPMMMMAALGAGVLLLMQRGQATVTPPPDARAQAPAPAPPAVAPFETGGDDARDITELGPTTPIPSQTIPVQPGDRKAVTPRAEPLVKPVQPVPAARRGPQIVAMTSQPTIR
jgi:hypothetical protein